MASVIDTKHVVNDPDVQDFANANFDHPKPRVRKDWWARTSRSILAAGRSQRSRSNLKYTELKGDQIRLLRILPRQFPRTSDGDETKDQIKCELGVFSLSKVKGKYEALSYRWGDKNFDKRIWIRTVYEKKTPKKDATSHMTPIPENDGRIDVERRDSHHDIERDNHQPNLMDKAVRYGAKHKVNGADVQESTNNTLFEMGPYFQFPIHENLFYAIWHLRLEKEPMFFWIDAICINQNDTEEARREKYNQFSMMGGIYNSAANVCIWLGAGGHGDALDHLDFQKGFNFVDSIMDLDKLDTHLKNNDDETKENWLSLIHTLKAPWFKRRWIIQEVALARRASVHFGYLYIDWAHLENAIALLTEKSETLHSLFPRCRPVTQILHLSAVTLAKALQNVCRKSDNGDILENILDLETLVCTFQQFQALRPEDIIHSVSALARDHPNADTDPELKFDPKASTRDLFIKFVCRCIKHSKSLDIICRHWAPQARNSAGQEVVLPSWISSLSKSPYGLPGGFGELQNGENLVAKSADDERPRYNASRGFLAAFGSSSGSTSVYNTSISLVTDDDVSTLPTVSILTQDSTISPPPSRSTWPQDKKKTQYTSEQLESGLRNGTTAIQTQNLQPGNEDLQSAPLLQTPVAKIRSDSFEVDSSATSLKKEVQSNAGIKEEEGQSRIDFASLAAFKFEGQIEQGGSQDTAKGSQSSTQHLRPQRPRLPERSTSVSSIKSVSQTLRRQVSTKPTQMNHPQENDREHNKVVPGLLKVSGIILGTVADLSEPMRRGVVPGEWLRNLGWKRAIPNVPETVWRTLVADRSPGGGNPLGWYSLACFHCLTDDRITDDEGDMHANIEDELPEQVSKYLSRVRSVIWKRRILRVDAASTKMGESLDLTYPMFGLGPQETEKHDIVCILFGCSVPVVLRPTRKIPEDLYPPDILPSQTQFEDDDGHPTGFDFVDTRQQVYKVIGEAYIHGKMNGEAVRNQERSKEERCAFILE
jgi:hypothetical protein